VDPALLGLPAIAFALLVCLAFGRIAPRLGVPRVTVYLLVGLCLGPHGLPTPDGDGVLDAEAGATLDALARVSVGFILFGVGGEFSFPALRRVGARILAVAAGEVGVTAVLVAVGVYAATGSGALACVAPALAVATAPSATLVTLREVEAEGPVARTVILCVGLDNLAALLAFPLLLALAFGAGHPAAATGGALLALGAGTAVGLVSAVALEVISTERDQIVLGLFAVVASLGVALAIGGSSPGLGLLGCFAAGVAVANASPHAAGLLRRLDGVAYPLYVLFFIGSGRDLHLESLAALGGLGTLFVAARATGKLAGARLGLRLAGWGAELPGSLGTGLLCQAGVALALVAALEQTAPEPSAPLRHVVLASVVFFELVGPWLLRRTVVRSGEVKLSSLLRDPTTSAPEAIRWVGLELRRSLGLAAAGGGGEDVTVRHAMRRRPAVADEAQPFQGVLKALGEAGAEHLPVVDGEGRLRGVISYDEVKNALYDPVLRDLVIARDLAEDVPDPLHPETPLAEALEQMDRRGVHSWPVVEGEQLVGVVRRSDLYALLRRGLGRRARGSDAAS
jgi:Kef-type K+ transport system membrane component KefB/predicted transcriptional regulator